MVVGSGTGGCRRLDSDIPRPQITYFIVARGFVKVLDGGFAVSRQLAVSELEHPRKYDIRSRHCSARVARFIRFCTKTPRIAAR